MKKINTDDAPQAIGPYSQGVSVSLKPNQNFIFVSGMLPVDPKTGKMVEGDITFLTRQVLTNLKAVLEASGCQLHDVVRTDVFLADLKQDFPGMNEEYAQWFTGPVTPARQTIQPSALPMGARIEISCIAITTKANYV